MTELLCALGLVSTLFESGFNVTSTGKTGWTSWSQPRTVQVQYNFVPCCILNLHLNFTGLTPLTISTLSCTCNPDGNCPLSSGSNKRGVDLPSGPVFTLQQILIVYLCGKLIVFLLVLTKHKESSWLKSCTGLTRAEASLSCILTMLDEKMSLFSFFDLIKCSMTLKTL